MDFPVISYRKLISSDIKESVVYYYFVNLLRIMSNIQNDCERAANPQIDDCLVCLL